MLQNQQNIEHRGISQVATMRISLLVLLEYLTNEIFFVSEFSYRYNLFLTCDIHLEILAVFPNLSSWQNSYCISRMYRMYYIPRCGT